MRTLPAGRLVLLLASAVLLSASGCGGVHYAIAVNSAASKVEEAKAVGAEQLAPYEYYYPEKDQVRFQPANKNMAPIYVRAADFKPTMLLGVVVGVFRRV